MDDPTTRAGAPFPTTHLSVVELAAKADSPRYREAWQAFFTAYYPPLYVYLRRTGSPATDAQDLLQRFFLEGLTGRWIGGYDPSRGRLRTYLLACLSNFRLKDHRREAARPEATALPLPAIEDVESSIADARCEDPERAFEVDWAKQVLRRSLAQVRGRLTRDADARSLRILDEWILADERPGSESLAEALGVSSGDLRTRATRLRKDVAAEIEAQIRTWSPGAADVGEERNEILRCLAGKG